TFFDDMNLSKAQLVLSSGFYHDPILDMDINKGVSLIAEINPSTGPLANVGKIVKGIPHTLILRGSLGSSLKDLALQAVIPMSFSMGSKATFKDLALELGGDGPSISLLAQIEVIPSKHERDNPLLF